MIYGPQLARVAFALSAATVLTSTVAGPMAYQAYASRAEKAVVQFVDNRPDGPGTAVLPSTESQGPGGDELAESPTTAGEPRHPSFGVPETSAVELDATTASSSADVSRSAPTTPREPNTVRTRVTTSTTTARPPSGAAETPRHEAPSPTSVAVTAPPTSVAPSTPSTTGPRPTPPTSVAPSTPSTTGPTSPETTTTTTPVKVSGLYWSALAPRLPAKELQAAELSQPVYIFADAPNVACVVFYLDDRLTAIEWFTPWELFGGRRLHPERMKPGTHTVRVVIRFVDGTVSTRNATFTTTAK